MARPTKSTIPSARREAASPKRARRAAESPRNDPRTPLTRQRILDAAAALIEERSLAEFSLRALGARLGVEAMSLYHHFPSKGHLLDALFDDLLLAGPRGEPERTWYERTLQLAREFRATVLRRPAFAGFALTHRMNTPTALAYVERVASHFADGTLPVERAARQFRTLGYYLSGALLDETSGYARGPTAAEPVPLDEQARIAPSIVAMGPTFAPSEWTRTFEIGLESLVRAFEKEREDATRARPGASRG